MRIIGAVWIWVGLGNRESGSRDGSSWAWTGDARRVYPYVSERLIYNHSFAHQETSLGAVWFSGYWLGGTLEIDIGTKMIHISTGRDRLPTDAIKEDT